MFWLSPLCVQGDVIVSVAVRVCFSFKYIGLATSARTYPFITTSSQVREGHEMAVIRGKGAGAAPAGEDAAVKKGRKMTMEERLRYAQVVV